MSSHEITVDDRAGVRYITLNRPEKKNALTSAMYAAFADAVQTASGDDIGAVLLRANGGAFTAGNDLRDFLEHPPRAGDAPPYRLMTAMVTTDVPVVAAVRGPAVGIGTTMLLHCDLVYAAPTAVFRVPFVDLGLVPEFASSVLLPRRIGRARAGAALYLGDAINADAALAAGLVTNLVADAALDDAAEVSAHAIAAKPREAVRQTKRLLNHDRDELLAAIHRESEAFAERLVSSEARAAMSSFFERAAR